MRKASKDPIARTPAAQLLRAIAMEAISACDPRQAVIRVTAAGPDRLSLAGHRIDLRRRGRLLIFAYGKAAPGMLEGLRTGLSQAGVRRPVRALLIAPVEPPVDRAATAAAPRSAGAAPRGKGSAQRRGDPRGAADMKVARITGDHPLPLRGSFLAGRKALQMAAGARAADDVVYLASGGGSALMAAPLAPFMKPEHKTLLHRLLIVSGAPIGVINAVRRHLSAVKGGRLALAARRAGSQTTLVLCDVDPERYDEVASGPSLPDPTSREDLIRAIDRYGLGPAMPPSLIEALRRGTLPETPKKRDPAFRKSRAALLLSNRDLRSAAVRGGLTRGLSTESLPTDLTGPVEEAVERVARAVESAPPGTRLLVLGGEVVSVPSAPGVGGRAQEFALRLALRMDGLGSRPWAFLSAGSDGLDGNSPAAGAYVDQTTLERARSAGLDAAKLLREANSHRFFSRLGDDFVTGPTGTNVRDLYLLLTGVAGVPRRPITGAAPDRPPSPQGSES